MEGVVLSAGRLPAFGDVVDLTVLGVHSGSAGNRARYIPRDCHDEIVAALRPGAFVLVTGAPCAGKSRCAFEAVAEALPEHAVVVPRDRAGVGDAVTALGAHPRSVLWLDLDLYLGAGGLRTQLLASALGQAGGHRVVVATMTSTPPRPGPPMWGPGGVQRRFPRAALTVLDRARRIHLNRRFSPGELARARDLGGDPLIAAALDHPGVDHPGADHAGADRLGASELAVVLAGARGWVGGWRAAAAGANPRGAALVEAALECWRAGLVTAPRDLLEAVGEKFLRRSGAVSVTDPAAVAWQWPLAWEWAIGTGALREVHGRFRVPGYLLEHAGVEVPVPNTTLRAALEHADEAEAALIAGTAHHQGRLVLAEAAYRSAHDRCVVRFGAQDLVTLEVAHDRAVSLADRGRIHEAVAGLRGVLDTQQRVLGRGHPVTLASVQNLAALECADDRSGSAVARTSEAVRSHEAGLGTRHRATLACRFNLGIALGLSSRFDEAAEAFRFVAHHSGVALGTDHPATLAARHHLAIVLGSQQLWATAEAERDSVLAAQRRLWGNDHPATLTSRHERVVLLRGRGRLDNAIAELRGVLAARTAVLGSAHPATVSSRQLLADLRAERGDQDGLIEELETVRALRSGLYKPDHPATLQTRHTLAGVRWDLGDLDGAATELAAVLAARTRAFGPSALPTLAARHNLAVLTGERGNLEHAATELTAVARDCARVFGPQHPMTIAARHDEATTTAALAQRVPDTGNDEPAKSVESVESVETSAVHRRAVELYVAGDFNAAEPLLREVLAYHEQTLGAKHPSTLARAHEVAMVLHNRGLRAEAAALHRSVVTTRCTVLGVDDPATLASQHDLSIVLWELGDATGAVAGFQAALAGRARVLGPDHPDTVVSRNNLGVVLAQIGSEEDPTIKGVLPPERPGDGPHESDKSAPGSDHDLDQVPIDQPSRRWDRTVTAAAGVPSPRHSGSL